jgi:CTP synthase
MKIIVVTGGVVSSLGKGIAAASLGNLLHARGIDVVMQKMDPYLNLDPGTMSPYQHGEVFVTRDGTETDLDLGHYERFTDVPCNSQSTHTSGRVYERVLQKERDGDFLGSTVQVIPHITDEIRKRIEDYAEGHDVSIVEIGGTVGDIESTPFLEALRQMRRQLGPDMFFIHVTPVPYIKAASELKTKPTQHSVAELRKLGIVPDALLLRAETVVPDDLREKISLFCDLPIESVLSCPDARDIYEVPLILHEGGLDNLVAEKFGFPDKEPDLRKWQAMSERIIGSTLPIKVALVGKYQGHQDAYLSVTEALRHAAASRHRHLELISIDAEAVTEESAEGLLHNVDAILVPGGFGDRGFEGKIEAARYARGRSIPFLGICLGMQAAVLDIARHEAGIKKAQSREFAPRSRQCVIDLSDEQKNITARGGTMRLGSQSADIKKGTLLHKIYQQDQISERHRHRYEVSEKFVDNLENAGLIISARHHDRGLVEAIEIKDHPFFIGCQYHPELESYPTRPHPLFVGLLGG